MGCPSCGAENRPGRRFCGACGTVLSAALPTLLLVSATVAQRLDESLLLLVERHDGADLPIGLELDLWHLGTQWTDSLRGDELELLKLAQ